MGNGRLDRYHRVAGRIIPQTICGRPVFKRSASQGVGTVNKGSNVQSENDSDSAADRTLMAEERTFSAWIRTGLASVASGLGVVKLLAEQAPSRTITLLGVLLVIAGAMAFAFAFYGYRQGMRRWQAALPRAVPLWIIGFFTMLLALAAGLALLEILVG